MTSSATPPHLDQPAATRSLLAHAPVRTDGDERSGSSQAPCKHRVTNSSIAHGDRATRVRAAPRCRPTLSAAQQRGITRARRHSSAVARTSSDRDDGVTDAHYRPFDSSVIGSADMRRTPAVKRLCGPALALSCLLLMPIATASAQPTFVNGLVIPGRHARRHAASRRERRPLRTLLRPLLRPDPQRMVGAVGSRSRRRPDRLRRPPAADRRSTSTRSPGASRTSGSRRRSSSRDPRRALTPPTAPVRDPEP